MVKIINMGKERDKIKLTNEQWQDLVYEDYLELDEIEVAIEIVKEQYYGSTRHTEQHGKVFQRLDNEKYYQIDYETSVKDSMGWDECNYGDTVAFEVFPETVTTIIYK